MMVSLGALWMPILISAVLVFVASSLVHMVLPWHKKDFDELANEDQVMAALRSANVPPGDYMLPKPKSMDDMKSEAFQAKAKQGPRAVLTILGPWTGSMTPELSKWFVYVLVVSVYAAYVAGATLAPGTAYLRVFQVAGATAFACYAVAIWPARIWYKRSMTQTISGTIDGLIYALLTAGVFGWRWPKM